MAKEKTKDVNKKGKKDSPSTSKKKEESKSNSVNGDEKLETVNKELQDQLDAEKDRILRLSAEFENYRKRKQREIDDFKKFANESVFRQMLTVVDNLERAIQAAEEKSDEGGLLEGVKLTHKEILKLFETFNVKLVEAENKPFDPNFHQAVTQEENNDVPENTVTNVLQKGYTLNDRLIRPAMVVVSKRTQKSEEETEKTKKD